MTKVYINTSDYDNNVISNLSNAFERMKDVINFNNDIHPENDFQEKDRLYQYISDSIRIKDDIFKIIDWCESSKKNLETIENIFSDKVTYLPSREINKRKEIDI